jgi:hypothetical protein
MDFGEKNMSNLNRIAIGTRIAYVKINTNTLNEMLKRAQKKHDKKKRVIPNLFRNLGFGNGNKSIAFLLVQLL